MIRLVRGVVPPGWAETEQHELTRVQAVPPPYSEDDLGERYRDLRPVLAERQFHKCAFCESMEADTKYRGVDHYRPKLACRVSEGGPPGPGYWWLCWHWDNLLYACRTCNTNKGIRFPLRDPARRLPESTLPPGEEEPLLLNPYDSDVHPAVHLEFVLDPERRGEGNRLWRASPRANSVRGASTITVVGLDHADDRRKIRSNYLENTVAKRARRFCQRWITQDGSPDWEVVLELLEAGKPWVLGAFDVLCHEIPEPVRNRAPNGWPSREELPLPPLPPGPPVVFPDRRSDG
jgi:hypothetical protein